KRLGRSTARQRPGMIPIVLYALAGARSAIVRRACWEEDRTGMARAVDHIVYDLPRKRQVPRVNSGLLVHARKPGGVFGGAGTEGARNRLSLMLGDGGTGHGGAHAENAETHGKRPLLWLHRVRRRAEFTASARERTPDSTFSVPIRR